MARESVTDPCAGYLDHPFPETIPMQNTTRVPKTNWQMVSACHAGRLADHQTPVGSAEFIYLVFWN